MAYQLLDEYVKKAEVQIAVRASLLALDAPHNVMVTLGNALNLVAIHSSQYVSMVKVETETQHRPGVERFGSLKARSYAMDNSDLDAKSVASNSSSITRLNDTALSNAPRWRPSLRHSSAQTAKPHYAAPRRCRVNGRAVQTPPFDGPWQLLVSKEHIDTNEIKTSSPEVASGVPSSSENKNCCLDTNEIKKNSSENKNCLYTNEINLSSPAAAAGVPFSSENKICRDTNEIKKYSSENKNCLDTNEIKKSSPAVAAGTPSSSENKNCLPMDSAVAWLPTVAHGFQLSAMQCSTTGTNEIMPASPPGAADISHNSENKNCWPCWPADAHAASNEIKKSSPEMAAGVSISPENKNCLDTNEINSEYKNCLDTNEIKKSLVAVPSPARSGLGGLASRSAPPEVTTKKDIEAIREMAVKTLDSARRASSAAGCCPPALDAAARDLHSLYLEGTHGCTATDSQGLLKKMMLKLNLVLSCMDALLDYGESIKTQGLVKHPAYGIETPSSTTELPVGGHD